MAGFLRKLTTRKNPNAGVQQNTPLPPKPVTVADAPPSLPPLFARFTTPTPEEPDSVALSPMTPLPQSIQVPIPEDSILSSADWDTWKALIDPRPVSTPDPPPPVHPPPPKKVSSIPPLPETRRKYTGPGLPPKRVELVDVYASSDATDTYYTAQSHPPAPRTEHAVPSRQDRNQQQHPISATPPTATSIRDSAVAPSTHLLPPVKLTRPLSPEQVLITKPISPNPPVSPHPSSRSRDNQAPSYTPLNTRHPLHPQPASQDPPSLPHSQSLLPLQKPASTDSHTSSATQSSSNHSDATRITNAGSLSTPFTSTSSIAPAIKVTFPILSFLFRFVSG
ncbi:hypothetical protein M405DRAFT_68315 [Rhizopogon salebrosus TDB-379]|nr:hypothetical protein M405DRAFT_68315 [Rhizopogon salebrosus TDB-379]